MSSSPSTPSTAATPTAAAPAAGSAVGGASSLAASGVSAPTSAASPSPSPSPVSGGSHLVRVTRFTLIDTAEERGRWAARARQQWGGGRPLSVRVYSSSRLRGATRPVKLCYDAGGGPAPYPGWAGARWGPADSVSAAPDGSVSAASGGGPGPSAGIRVPLAEDATLMVEVVAAAGTRHPARVLGLTMVNAQAALAEGCQYVRLCAHVLPTQVPIDAGTVHTLLELEVRAPGAAEAGGGGGAGPAADGGSFTPLEYSYGSVRVSTLDLHFPAYLLASGGQYIVSNVVCAMNMTDSSSLAMQLVPLKGASAYVVAEPAHVITVRPQQRVYFSATWILQREACMRTLEMQLTVNGSAPPSAPIVLRVHNSAPQPSTGAADLPFQYWVNTTCATNRQMLASQELPLIRAILPVYRLTGSAPVSQTEGMIVAFDKDRGEQVLVRANGAPVALGTGYDASLLLGGAAGGGGGGGGFDGGGDGPSVLELLASHHSSGAASGDISRRLQELFPSDFGIAADGGGGAGGGADGGGGGGGSGFLSNASFVVRDRAAPAAAVSARGPLLNLAQKTCQCTVVLGTIRGLPMLWEAATGVSPAFRVSATLLDAQGWQIVHGETQPSYQSASGTLRWGQQLVLRKWPGASATQFMRLNLSEVRPRDGDETPIGAGLVSLATMHRIHAFNPLSVAFYVYETYSHYDQLSSPSLLMKHVSVIFSETR